jgi:hypothetical protein
MVDMVFTSRVFKRRLSRKAKKSKRKSRRNSRKQRGGNVLDGKLDTNSAKYGPYGTETGVTDVDL